MNKIKLTFQADLVSSKTKNEKQDKSTSNYSHTVFVSVAWHSLNMVSEQYCFPTRFMHCPIGKRWWLPVLAQFGSL